MQLSAEQRLSCPDLQLPPPPKQQGANIMGLEPRRPSVESYSGLFPERETGKSSECSAYFWSWFETQRCEGTEHTYDCSFTRLCLALGCPACCLGPGRWVWEGLQAISSLPAPPARLPAAGCVADIPGPAH